MDYVAWLAKADGSGLTRPVDVEAPDPQTAARTVAGKLHKGDYKLLVIPREYAELIPAEGGVSRDW